MDLTARDIHEKQFHDAWRGYDQEEVDDFLDRVAETLDRVQRENATLHSRIRELDTTVSTSRNTEEMMKRTLASAQRAAEEAITQAKAKAERLVAEAEERARRTSSSALAGAPADLRNLDATRARLEETVERLAKMEQEIRTRLRAFFEQQLRALETLDKRSSSQPAPLSSVQGARVEGEHGAPQPERPDTGGTSEAARAVAASAAPETLAAGETQEARGSAERAPREERPVPADASGDDGSPNDAAAGETQAEPSRPRIVQVRSSGPPASAGATTSPGPREDPSQWAADKEDDEDFEDFSAESATPRDRAPDEGGSAGSPYSGRLS